MSNPFTIMIAGLRRGLSPIFATLAFLAMWEMCVVLLDVRPILLPAPHLIAQEIAAFPLWFLENTFYTLGITLLGFAVAVLLGVLFAIAIVESPAFERMVFPLFVALNSVPKVAIAPLFIIWLGTGAEPKIAITTLIAVFAVVIDASLGLRSVQPDILDLAKVLHGSRLKVLWRIKLPCALPRLFSLTPRILVLAGGFLQARQFGKTIEPVIQTFSNQIAEAISMAMIDGSQAVYVAHARERASAISIGFTVGSKVPLLTTAIGRALVSACPPEMAAELIRSAPLEAHTPSTQMDRDVIAEDIALTAKRGHAFVDDQFEAGVAAIAVPIRADGVEPSALGVSGSSEHFTDPAFTRAVIDTLRNCAKVVGGLL